MSQDYAMVSATGLMLKPVKRNRGVVMWRRYLNGNNLEQIPSVWTSRGALLWLFLNLVDLVESLAARSIGCGELNPLIPLDSPVLALTYKGLLAMGVLIFLESIRKPHLLRWLNVAMLAVVVWNALAILMSR
jgi:hypothetical protein